MPDKAPSSTRTDHHLGERLRQRRETIGLSVRTLASRAGFSPSFLSQVENGLASPSIGSLEKIAACLEVSLAELFQQPAEAASAVIRATERPRLESGWSQAEIESLRSDRRSRLEPLLITLQPGGASGRQPHAVPREQFVFVLGGQATLSLGSAFQLLAAGDAVTLAPGAPALWANHSEHPVQLLFISPSTP